MELFPAVMIGGPPHSGKSVLAYSLTQALRQQGIPHYVLRAFPDGEGDWANEADQALVRQIRVKGAGTPEWIAHICRDIANRHLPLIVDVGGRPTEWQEAVFAVCTHAILLTPNAEARRTWQGLVNKHALPRLADLHSTLSGQEFVESVQPILTGQISNLDRGHTANGPTFQTLVDLLVNLFIYDQAKLSTAHRSLAPVELVIELERIRQVLKLGDTTYWSPEHLPELLAYLPKQTSLGIYDRGPNWLYAALACHIYPAELYQFDARLGWIAPPELVLNSGIKNPALITRSTHRESHVWLEIELKNSYLDYSEAQGLPVPCLSTRQGIVLSGKLPLWLWTALGNVYHRAPWLAIYQPQLDNKAVVVASRVEHIPIGGLVHSYQSHEKFGD